MLKPLLPYSLFSTSRGSALIGTLVMVGILGLSVGVMLSSSNRSIRGSREKILYEEAYQTALSGTHITRAWMIDPELIESMTGDDDLADEIADLVWRGLEMNDQIIFDRERDNNLDHYGTKRYVDEGFTLGATLSDGRRLLYDFPKDSPIVSFINDKDNKKFTNNLFQGTPAKGHRNYVESIRITTAPHDPATTSVSLLETTFVIESTGVAEYAGTRKERTVQQRVLLFPKKPGGALLSAGEAILTKAGMHIAGKSHANVHWAPVLAKSNIALEFLKGLVKKTDSSGKVTWELATEAGNGKKFNGAGIAVSDPNFDATGVIDKWLHWKAGTNGVITGSDGNSLFSQLTLPAGTTVGDFFEQVIKGTFSGTPNGLTKDNLILLNEYATAGTTMANPNGLYVDESGNINGGFVQGDPAVDTQVDTFFGTMNYLELKEYAKAHNGYYYYDGTKLYDSTGRETAMPDMVGDVPSGSDPLLVTAAQDRILFIDSAADRNSVEPKNPFSAKLALPRFWKGVMYVNGSVVSSGTGSSPNLKVRTPDQFKAYRESGVSGTHVVKNVLMDGILICNGIADLGGQTAIYGTLGALGGVGLGGTPSVFYNSANGEGRMKSDQSMSAEFRLIAGRLYE